MPDHDRLLHTAHLQLGYVTTRQAADSGFSRQLCNHYCRKGAWTNAARGIYRLHAVPDRPDAHLALTHLRAVDHRGRTVGVFSHTTALYLHGLAAPPSTVHLSVPPAAAEHLGNDVALHHRRIDLPWMTSGMPTRAQPREEPPLYPLSPYYVDPYWAGLLAAGPLPIGRWDPWAEPWHARALASGPERTTDWRRPPLTAEDIEERAPFRVTSPLRGLLDCLVWGTPADLSTACDRGLALGLFTLDALFGALDGLPTFPGTRGLVALLDAVRARAARVEREVVTVRLRHRASRDLANRTDDLPDRPDGDDGLPPSLTPFTEEALGEALGEAREEALGEALGEALEGADAPADAQRPPASEAPTGTEGAPGHEPDS